MATLTNVVSTNHLFSVRMIFADANKTWNPKNVATKQYSIRAKSFGQNFAHSNRISIAFSGERNYSTANMCAQLKIWVMSRENMRKAMKWVYTCRTATYWLCYRIVCTERIQNRNTIELWISWSQMHNIRMGIWNISGRSVSLLGLHQYLIKFIFETDACISIRSLSHAHTSHSLLLLLFSSLELNSIPFQF